MASVQTSGQASTQANDSDQNISLATFLERSRLSVEELENIIKEHREVTKKNREELQEALHKTAPDVLMAVYHGCLGADKFEQFGGWAYENIAEREHQVPIRVIIGLAKYITFCKSEMTPSDPNAEEDVEEIHKKIRLSHESEPATGSDINVGENQEDVEKGQLLEKIPYIASYVRKAAEQVFLDEEPPEKFGKWLDVNRARVEHRVAIHVVLGLAKYIEFLEKKAEDAKQGDE